MAQDTITNRCGYFIGQAAEAPSQVSAWRVGWPRLIWRGHYVEDFLFERQCTEMPRPCASIPGKHGFSTRPSRSGPVVTWSCPGHVPDIIFGTERCTGFVFHERNMNRFPVCVPTMIGFATWSCLFGFRTLVPRKVGLQIHLGSQLFDNQVT
jgi:hypothetical protein